MGKKETQPSVIKIIFQDSAFFGGVYEYTYGYDAFPPFSLLIFQNLMLHKFSSSQ
jgi:hypothetical protein